MTSQKNTATTIMVVDDDTGHRTMLRLNLESLGYRVVEVTDGDELLDGLKKLHPVDLILLDMKMKRLGGLETLELLQHEQTAPPIIIITAFSSIESVVTAMKKGAYDYITKPIDITNLAHILQRATEHTRLKQENLQLRRRLEDKYNFSNIIGSSQPMQQMFETLALVAESDATVLIGGESGTGKELVANAIHENSLRRERPFIKLNCSALNEELLESELFGHEAGAFTGASTRRKGRFELAHRGTLLLDEIGDMSQKTQTKILRVLQEGEFERLGGNETIRVDVRLLAATHKDLPQMIEDGSFRQDLYYRLAVVPIELPPLRDRREDMTELSHHFLKKYTEKNRKNIKSFHPETLAIFMRYDWPGNIRELENTIERGVILCLGDQITPQALPPHIQPDPEKQLNKKLDTDSESWTLKDMEREMIRATLLETANNKSLAAKKLGIARQTLLNKLREFKL